MLQIVIDGAELYDDEKNEFYSVEKTILNLEHSLVSISKWEAKYHKPFFDSMEKRLSEMEAEMSNIPTDEIAAFMDNYHKIQHQFDLQGGYTFRSEAIGILKGLGFEGDDLNKSMNELSGGQKTRVSLGRLLASSPDLLLLDEPINHLDLNSIVWLEGYLSSYKGSVVILLL